MCAISLSVVFIQSLYFVASSSEANCVADIKHISEPVLVCNYSLSVLSD